MKTHRPLGWVLVVTLLVGCAGQIVRKAPPPPAPPETTRFRLTPGNSVIGHIYRLRLRDGDTLADVARHFAIGLQALQDANPSIDPWIPPAGKEIILPLAFVLPAVPGGGIVINLAAMRLFHFTSEKEVETYPVGIGRAGWKTPLGTTRIVQKKKHPRWVVPASILREHAIRGDPLPRVVPPGPDNPLGNRALRLGFPGYLIHGTNKPYGVGLRISHGCIRLYPENIETLFAHTKVGTRVTIVDQPYLLGWWGKQLYLEAHPPLQAGEGERRKKRRALIKRLRNMAEKSGLEIDWKRVRNTLLEARGIPVPILKSSPDLERLLARLLRMPHPGRWPHAPELPPLAPGWLVTLDIPLTDRAAGKLTAILRHQTPPIPAHQMGDQVIIGPYEDQRGVNAVLSRLKRDLGLKGRTVTPVASRSFLKAPASHSLYRTNASP